METTISIINFQATYGLQKLVGIERILERKRSEPRGNNHLHNKLPSHLPPANTACVIVGIEQILERKRSEPRGNNHLHNKLPSHLPPANKACVIVGIEQILERKRSEPRGNNHLHNKLPSHLRSANFSGNRTDFGKKEVRTTWKQPSP